jgi:hypothetical protein
MENFPIEEQSVLPVHVLSHRIFSIQDRLFSWKVSMENFPIALKREPR